MLNKLFQAMGLPTGVVLAITFGGCGVIIVWMMVQRRMVNSELARKRPKVELTPAFRQWLWEHGLESVSYLPVLDKVPTAPPVRNKLRLALLPGPQEEQYGTTIALQGSWEGFRVYAYQTEVAASSRLDEAVVLQLPFQFRGIFQAQKLPVENVDDFWAELAFMRVGEWFVEAERVPELFYCCPELGAAFENSTLPQTSRIMAVEDGASYLFLTTPWTNNPIPMLEESLNLLAACAEALEAPLGEYS
jgi:hypothetical protein